MRAKSLEEGGSAQLFRKSWEWQRQVTLSVVSIKALLASSFSEPRSRPLTTTDQAKQEERDQDKSALVNGFELLSDRNLRAPDIRE